MELKGRRRKKEKNEMHARGQHAATRHLFSSIEMLRAHKQKERKINLVSADFAVYIDNLVYADDLDLATSCQQSVSAMAG